MGLTPLSVRNRCAVPVWQESAGQTARDKPSEQPHAAMTFLDQSLPRAAPDAATLKPLGLLARQRSLIWTHGAVLAAALAAFSLWLMSGAVVPWDSKNHFYPMFRFLGDALANGTIPLWNPYHFGGHPTVADPQSLLFTPTMALFAWIVPHASMQVFDAMIFAHLVMGGIFVLAVCRARGLEPAAGVLAAVIFMLGGAASSRLQHTGMIISYAFFPAAFWALERVLTRAKIRDGLSFGLFAALMALGRDQVAFLFALVLIGRAVAAFAGARERLAFARSRALPVFIGGLLAAAILAVPALLTMQFLGGSNRPGIAFGIAAAGSLAPVNLATLLVPNIFGSLDHTYSYWGPGYETMTDPDWTDRAVNYLFIGTVPAVLLLWHGFAGGRLFARANMFLLAAAGLALLYALGRTTPVFNWLFDMLPGVSLYRRPADATFLFNVGLAFASASLLHRYIRDGLPRIKGSLVRSGLSAITGLGVVSLIVGALVYASDANQMMPALGAIALAGLLVAAIIACLIYGERHHARAFAAMLVVAGGATELIWRNAASAMNAEPQSYYSVHSGMKLPEAAALEALRTSIAKRMANGERPRVEILGLGGAWQNASMVLKLENTLGYNPLRIADYERAVGPGENAGDPNLRQFPDTFRGWRCALAGLLSLDYLVLDRPLDKLPRHVPRPQATQLYAGDGIYVYELGRTSPRAVLAYSVKPTDTDQVIADHALPGFDRTREALVDETQAKALSPALIARVDDASAPAPAPVTITSYSDNQIVLDVDDARGGLVVLHDLYYPGWEARIDGMAAPIIKANLLFRGVEVPPGAHRITFVYQPFSLANLTNAAQGLLHKSEE